MGWVKLRLQNAKLVLECRKLVGLERVGAPFCFELLAYAPDPIAVDAVLGKAGALEFETASSFRLLVGVVSAFTSIATTQAGTGRQYRVRLESSLCLGRYRRESFVHQHLSADKMITKVLGRVGISEKNLQFSLQGSLPKRDYTVQYDETVENFVQRLCQREGLGYFSSYESAQGGIETITFFNDSKALKPIPDVITIVDDSSQNNAGQLVWCVERSRRRRPGSVRLRDYDPWGSDPKLEALTTAGTDLEQSTEVYQAPGLFKNESEGKKRAQLMMERLRGDADAIRFKSNSLHLHPGTKFKLVSTTDFAEGEPFVGEYVAHTVRHAYRHEEARHIVEVEAIPAKTPWRRTGNSAQPRIYGLQSALVTGSGQEEIHPDAHGSVFIRYFWDREGPTDNKSSCPVRVAQPNTPGSMNIPRVGWEVFVAHENGDPDRPIVVGRAYNAQQMPPFDLPANKTISALRSSSSPGAGTMNSIHMEDAAGRQHFHVFAGFGKSTTVANNMKTQTAKVEEKTITGNQSTTVGANETVSVGQRYSNQVGTQTITVGASQSAYIQGNFDIKTGSEVVVVGGALLEKVGNPVAGLKALGISVAMTVAGALAGKAGGALGGKLGGALGTKIGTFVGTQAVTIGGGAGKAAILAPQQGKDPTTAVLTSVAGGVIGMIPGASMATSAFAAFGGKYPWEKPSPPAGAQQAGGGAGGAKADSAAAKGPGPGYRKETIKGAWAEAVGGAMTINTPGNVKWETYGASAFIVGGSHVIKAESYSQSVYGAYVERLGSLKVTAKTNATGEYKSSVAYTISGQLTVKASGEYTLHSDANITLKAASMNLKGAHVTFKVGSSVVSMSPGGLEVKASTIEIKGATKQGGNTGHG